MANDDKKGWLETYYKNLARVFKGGPVIRQRIANKISAPGFSGVPVGTAKAFLRQTSNTYASQLAAYGAYNRLARYSDYCEMETLPEIGSALDIYADGVCSKDEHGQILTIRSANREIERSLNSLFYDTLNIEFNAWSWVRNLGKYGDQFLLLDHHPDYGVLGLYPMPVNEVEREEGYDKADPTAYRYRWLTQGNRLLENWQVIHFRLLGSDNFLPYGSSILEPVRRVWRQLILMEDAVMVYRIVRSPERRVFYIDVGNIPPNDIPNYMEKVKTQTKRSMVVDNTTGRVDLRYNALSSEEDYYIPVRGDVSSRIESLPGGQFTGDIEDLQYIQSFRKDTKIKLLDGTSDNIKNIVERINNKESLWTYSINPETLYIEPSRILAGQNVGKKNNFVRITLDNEKILDVTDEHLLMLSNGKYIHAKELKKGDSLASLYTKISSKENKNYLDGYEMLYDLGKNRWDYTHRVVAKCCLKKDLKRLNVVHHASFNRLNNSPDHLTVFENSQQHRDFHAKFNKENKLYAGKNNPNWNLKANLETLIGAARLSKNTKELCEKTGYKSYIIHRLIKELGLSYCEFHKKYMIYNSTVFRYLGYNLTIEDLKEVLRWPEVKSESDVCKALNCSVIVIKRILKKSIYKNFDHLYDEIKERNFDKIVCCVKQCSTIREISEKLNCSQTKVKNEIKKNGFDSVKQFRKFYKMPNYRTPQMFQKKSTAANQSVALNHKVVSVEKLNIVEDAYDIQVENNHNFSVESGIFVHNSKLFAGLKIPKSYLGYEQDVTGKAQLCLDLNTEIPLLDGRNISLKQIIDEYNIGKELYAYSIDTNNQNIIHGKIKWAGITQKNASTVRVWFDNGKYLDCTFNHEFVMGDGKKKQVNQISIGDSVMSFCGKIEKSTCIDLTNNHKIVKIEQLNEKMDVGCLTIDNEFHNFAINSGIFVGNSQEDVRFAQTIQRIQRMFISELNKIAIIHLYSMGYSEKDFINFDIEMANPSTIAEMQKLELWRSKLEVASSATSQEGLVDKRFIYKNIFDLSDDDISEIEEGKRKDRMFDTELEQMQAEASQPSTGVEGLPPSEETPPAPEETPPPPETPSEGEPINAGKDPSLFHPNRQSVMPNDLKGDGTKAIKKKKTIIEPNLKNYVYNTEKNGLSHKDTYQQLKRTITAPFGENLSNNDITRKEQQIFEKRVNQVKKFADTLEKVDILKSARHNKMKKNILKS